MEGAAIVISNQTLTNAVKGNVIMARIVPIIVAILTPATITKRRMVGATIQISYVVLLDHKLRHRQRHVMVTNQIY